MSQGAAASLLRTPEEPLNLQFYYSKCMSGEMCLNLKALRPGKKASLSFAKDPVIWEDFFDHDHRERAKHMAGARVSIDGTGGETQPTKKPGDMVNFMVKIMNTDTEAAGYIVKVMIAEQGSDEWTLLDLEECIIEPMTYKYMKMGDLELSDDMASKYYDTLFKLVDIETGAQLDETILERAWYVSEPAAAGVIMEKRVI